jgi:tryptophanyl-tRNA synthetase
MAKTVLSGIKPSGIPTLGNYIGAISHWVELQSKYPQALFPIVDLHAITVPQDPKVLREQTYLVAALLLAAGIDPKRSIVFLQSHVSAHSELAWLLTTVTTMGQLNRMTQYKDKAGLASYFQRLEVEIPPKTQALLASINTIGSNANQMQQFIDTASSLGLPLSAEQHLKLSSMKDSIKDNLIAARKNVATLAVEIIGVREKIDSQQSSTGVGLFEYPVLMAADILLYQTAVVPVGEDQKQHVELARDIAERFNKRFGKTFVIPEPVMRKEGARIMDLLDPTKKMSKSADDKGCILLTDTADIIRKKIMRAVTDSGSTIVFDPSRKGLYNLLTIYRILSNQTEAKIEQHFKNSGYGDLKLELAELIIHKLAPIQTKVAKYHKDKKTLDKIILAGDKKATKIANQTLAEVKQKIGLVV